MGFIIWQDSVVIRPDLSKLDLSVKDFINLNDLSADDSGRTVGPKAAKLGELRKHFPEAVSPGVTIPFGVFREVVLDKPYKGSDTSGCADAAASAQVDGTGLWFAG
jgi:hypothetical protein